MPQGGVTEDRAAGQRLQEIQEDTSPCPAGFELRCCVDCPGQRFLTNFHSQRFTAHCREFFGIVEPVNRLPRIEYDGGGNDRPGQWPPARLINPADQAFRLPHDGHCPADAR